MVPIKKFIFDCFISNRRAYLLECEDSSLAAETAAAAAAASKPGNFGLLGNCKFSELVRFRWGH